MARHVEIAEATAILKELVAAAVDGEDIVLDLEGKPQARLVVIGRAVDAYLEERWERKFGPAA